MGDKLEYSNLRELDNKHSGLERFSQVNFIRIGYQIKKIRNVKRNTLKTNPRNLTHPIFVRKSYRYLGTPPRIAERKTKQIASLLVNIKV